MLRKLLSVGTLIFVAMAVLRQGWPEGEGPGGVDAAPRDHIYY